MPKIGLLDYVLGIGHDLRELDAADRRARNERVAQLREVLPCLGPNVTRLITRRWKHYACAAVIMGAPVPLVSWYSSQPDLSTVPRAKRLARVAEPTTRSMERIGALIPVTPVPLSCAAMLSVGSELLLRGKRLQRIEARRDELVELNAHVSRVERSRAETLALALRMPEMHHPVLTQDDGHLILLYGREMVSYCANSNRAPARTVSGYGARARCTTEESTDDLTQAWVPLKSPPPAPAGTVEALRTAPPRQPR